MTSKNPTNFSGGRVKDNSCEEHKNRNEICLIQISDKVEKEYHSQEVKAVASYNKKGELVSIEFYDGIPKNIKVRGKMDKYLFRGVIAGAILIGATIIWGAGYLNII